MRSSGTYREKQQRPHEGKNELKIRVQPKLHKYRLVLMKLYAGASDLSSRRTGLLYKHDATRLSPQRGSLRCLGMGQLITAYGSTLKPRYRT
jgi:hypothetical protein